MGGGFGGDVPDELCYQWAREAGFDEICGDIMLALPEYTNAEFDRTLALLRDGGCTHISA